MAWLIDSFKNEQAEIDGKWWTARPLNCKREYLSIWRRIKDAIGVITGKYNAIKFYKQ